MTKEIIKKITRKFGFEITKYSPYKKLISLKPEKGYRGNVLLSYFSDLGKGMEIFALKDSGHIPITHTNYWESLQIAKTFLDFGYCVDVMNFHSKAFIPKKDYSFFIGARTNFDRFAQLLNKDCIKIVHLDTAHWVFNNNAAYKRILDLQQRKGVTITICKRMVDKNLAIEYADYATVLGNQFTISTYSYAQKPIYRIPISTPVLYPWPEDKNYETCRNHFLWFGGSGLLHKGLDLVLDAFSDMPDHHLTVCGPIKEEQDFENAYYKELYQTPNIHTVGWIDVSSQEFIDIMNNCIGFIYPSCSEGQSGAVVSCLHGGLIPIISYESGVDTNDFGVILKYCSIDTIRNTVQMISNLPAEKLRQMTRKAWEYARENHTREKFAEEYKKVISTIIDDHCNKEELLEN